MRSKIVLGFAIMLLAGCNGGSSFNRGGAFGFDIGGDPTGDSPTISTDPASDPGDPTPKDPPPICDPLGGGDTGSTENGLVAKLTYLDPNPSSSSLVLDQFKPGEPDVTEVVNKVFLSRLNKATSPFDEGFADKSGNLLKQLDGDVLIEYFALFISSQVKLAASDPEGDYEFALLADDGAVLYLASGSDWVEWIDIDGTHPNKVGCSPRPVTLRRGDKLPIEVGYFQAPRFHIALMLFWRTGSKVGTAEPFCDGNHRGNEFFFTPSDAGPVPTANYQAFLDRGWKPVAASNFELPESIGENPCQ